MTKARQRGGNFKAGKHQRSKKTKQDGGILPYLIYKAITGKKKRRRKPTPRRRPSPPRRPPPQEYGYRRPPPQEYGYRGYGPQRGITATFFFIFLYFSKQNNFFLTFRLGGYWGPAIRKRAEKDTTWLYKMSKKF